METQKPVIIYALWQIPMILLIALIIGVGFNHFRSTCLPLVYHWSQPKLGGLNISLTEAALLFQQKKAVFLDARPVELYDKGHIKGALSLPWNNVDERLTQVMDKISPDDIIITYCDGPACDLSHMLANFMINMGFGKVHVLSNGWTVWKENQLPTEKSKNAGP